MSAAAIQAALLKLPSGIFKRVGRKISHNRPPVTNERGKERENAIRDPGRWWISAFKVTMPDHKPLITREPTFEPQTLYTWPSNKRLIMCRQGFHASPLALDAMSHALLRNRESEAQHKLWAVRAPSIETGWTLKERNDPTKIVTRLLWMDRPITSLSEIRRETTGVVCRHNRSDFHWCGWPVARVRVTPFTSIATCDSILSVFGGKLGPGPVSWGGNATQMYLKFWANVQAIQQADPKQIDDAVRQRFGRLTPFVTDTDQTPNHLKAPASVNNENDHWNWAADKLNAAFGPVFTRRPGTNRITNENEETLAAVSAVATALKDAGCSITLAPK